MTIFDEPEPTARPTRPWCLFHSGTRGFAVGLEAVAEVVEFERLVRLPLSPPRLAGLCTLRREVLPVVALGPSGGHEPRDRRLVMILKTTQGTWGVEVSGEGTLVAEEPLATPAPAADPASPWLIFAGTVRRADQDYPAIDPEATWRSVRDGVESYYAGRWADAGSV